MKTALIVAGLGMLFVAGSAQPPADPIEAPPGVTIVVRKHPTGADLVEITMLDPEYPEDLLRTQCEAIGLETGSAVRGLAVYRHKVDPSNAKLAFVKAQFGTDGLIDRQTGALRIEPLVRPFAGNPADKEIRNISISFAGERPGVRTLQRYLSDSVALVGRATQVTPVGVDYRVALLKQDGRSIQIPDLSPVTEAKPDQQGSDGFGATTMIWVLVAVAAIATGALVYFALLRSGRTGRKS